MTVKDPGETLAGLQCPLPIEDYPTISLAHGGGGRMTRMLIEKMLLPAFDNPALATLGDGALLDVEAGRLAVSTDSFVISPLFFPGGDIGSLAVHGTINDVAMCGARPFALSAAFILEEGLPMETLWRIVQSMRRAALEAGLPIVTGDTKVVDHGKADGVFINTTGFGRVAPGIEVGPQRARPGDVVLINGSIADHGIAVMSVREGLTFETSIESDSTALHRLTAGLLAATGEGAHVLRDPTRGGVASALNEIATAASVGIEIDEARIPIREEVRGACEILGLDPLYVANEGKCLAIVEAGRCDAALAALRENPLGRDSAVIGRVSDGPAGKVTLRSRIGGSRFVDLLSGEQLPRIC